MVRVEPGARVSVSEGAGESEGSGVGEDSGYVCVGDGLADILGLAVEGLPVTAGEQAVNSAQRIMSCSENSGVNRVIPEIFLRVMVFSIEQTGRWKPAFWKIDLWKTPGAGTLEKSGFARRLKGDGGLVHSVCRCLPEKAEQPFLSNPRAICKSNRFGPACRRETSDRHSGGKGNTPPAPPRWIGSGWQRRVACRPGSI